MNNVWYEASGKKYNEEGEPCFFRPHDFTWAVEIENHWQEFKGEIEHLIKETDKQFTSNSYAGLTTGDSWSSYTFLFWKKRMRKIRLCDKCPTLYNYLKDIPGLVSFSFSRLAPQTTLNRHRGDTNAVMRCHLGVEIPAGLPDCGLQAGNELQGWVEGKWLFFNDAFIHSAWNNTDKRRIVIIMDVIRPEFLYKTNRICAGIRARHIVLFITDKIKFLKKLGPIFRVPCFGLAYIYTYLFHNQSL